MDPLLVIGGLGLFMIVFWPLTLARALSHIMTNAFFGAERPLASSEYRRFLLSTMLIMVSMALGLIIVSPTGQHPHVEYHQPIGILRLILASIIAGLVLGVGAWTLIKLQMKRQAKFHHPSLATWKGIGFWGPKKRKMTLDEQKLFLQRLDLGDYLEFVRFVILSFVLLSFLIIALSLVFDAPRKGILPGAKAAILAWPARCRNSYGNHRICLRHRFMASWPILCLDGLDSYVGIGKSL